jgi:hypothetical protein
MLKRGKDEFLLTNYNNLRPLYIRKGISVVGEGPGGRIKLY